LVLRQRARFPFLISSISVPFCFHNSRTSAAATTCSDSASVGGRLANNVVGMEKHLIYAIAN